VIRLTILGQACSKSNRSQIVKLGDRVSIGKSADAKVYIRDTLKQIPPAARQRLQGPLRFTVTLYYESERPDLDESQLLDCLQDQWKRDKATGQRVLVQPGVYRNDNQVREKHIYWGIDKRNPRAEIMVEPLQAQQQPLLGEEVLPKFADQLDPAGVAF
jgi:Holliday junction resolvase RusA-like endonuclease